MVVSKVPRIADAARNVALPSFLLLLWDVGVTAVYLRAPAGLRSLELPLSLFGTAIALFTGIAVNAAYARWWEARGLWGALVNASRSLARQALASGGPAAAESLGAGGGHRDIPREMVRAQIAFALAMRAALRGEPPVAAAKTFVTPALATSLEVVGNAPNAILTAIGRLAAEAQRGGVIDGFGRLRLDTTLVDLGNAQGGLERIRNTPLPVHYAVFPTLFARVFCVLLPFAVVDDLRLFTPVGSALVSLMFLMAVQIGRDLAEPFADDVHAVPMAAICRTIEIDLLEMLGEPAPPKIAPRDGVLW